MGPGEPSGKGCTHVTALESPSEHREDPAIVRHTAANESQACPHPLEGGVATASAHAFSASAAHSTTTVWLSTPI
jgi:hypothetical protein